MMKQSQIWAIRLVENVFIISLYIQNIRSFTCDRNGVSPDLPLNILHLYDFHVIMFLIYLTACLHLFFFHIIFHDFDKNVDVIYKFLIHTFIKFNLSFAPVYWYITVWEVWGSSTCEWPYVMNIQWYDKYVSLPVELLIACKAA